MDGVHAGCSKKRTGSCCCDSPGEQRVQGLSTVLGGMGGDGWPYGRRCCLLGRPQLVHAIRVLSTCEGQCCVPPTTHRNCPCYHASCARLKQKVAVVNGYVMRGLMLLLQACAYRSTRRTSLLTCVPSLQVSGYMAHSPPKQGLGLDCCRSLECMPWTYVFLFPIAMTPVGLWALSQLGWCVVLRL